MENKIYRNLEEERRQEEEKTQKYLYALAIIVSQIGILVIIYSSSSNGFTRSHFFSFLFGLSVYSMYEKWRSGKIFKK